MSDLIRDHDFFGKTVYDYKCECWVASFADARFRGWGSTVGRFREEDSIGVTPEDPYDEPLDEESLRKVGRFRLEMPDMRDQHAAAWKAFLDGGDALARSVAERLFTIYSGQHAERVRWWKKIYPDSHEQHLPRVATSDEMRAIVRPEKFIIHPDNGEGVTVGILLDNLWAEKTLEVVIRNGQVHHIRPEVRDETAWSAMRNVPPFGTLRLEKNEGWYGTFHTDILSGFRYVSQKRYEFANDPYWADFARRHRALPPWSALTGDFSLEVIDYENAGPSDAQAEAYRKFRSEPDRIDREILEAVFRWYVEIQPDFIANMNGTREELLATLPELNSPEGLLDIMELNTVTVQREEEGDDAPPVITLWFSWEDEHGIGVRWRDGHIEDVGDGDICYQ